MAALRRWKGASVLAALAMPCACSNASQGDVAAGSMDGAAGTSSDGYSSTPTDGTRAADRGAPVMGDAAAMGSDGSITGHGGSNTGSDGSIVGAVDATLPSGGTSDAANEGSPADSGSAAGDGATGETVGTGDINAPAMGPAPSLVSAIGGGPLVLVKNWDFGTNGTIRNASDLIAEFQFHDQFGTIANGTHYGGVIVAPSQASAIGNLDPSLNLPNNTQPVEDPARPTRIFTADTIQCVLQPLSAAQTTCTVSKHDVGAGSLIAKWMPAHGGMLLGRDILWETRMRLVSPCADYWFSLWTSGNQWNGGAEMDTPESFGSSNVFPPAHLFHVNSVGGSDAIDYSNWSTGLTSAGVPNGATDLTQWHVWTWLYRSDDTYVSWFDGYQVQHGSIHWTLGGTAGGTPINMTFLFDFTWGHTQVSSVNVSGVAASSVQMTYEVDYSRVYLR